MEPCFDPTLFIFRPDAGAGFKLPPQGRLRCLGLDAARPLCPIPVMLSFLCVSATRTPETAIHIENHILAHKFKGPVHPSRKGCRQSPENIKGQRCILANFFLTTGSLPPYLLPSNTAIIDVL